MDLIKQFKGIFLETPLEDNENIDEYIDLLVERLISSYRVEDQIESIKALLAIARIRKYQIQVGAKAIDPLLSILENKSSAELISLALECLKHIISSVSDNELPKFDSQFSEIFLKETKHLAIVIKLTEEYDFSIKYTALQLFKSLLINAAPKVQASLLQIENGISKILDLLNDTREVIRNEALISLVHLSKGNQDLQKIIAFENAFEIILNILRNEDFSNGGIISCDCLKVLLNLLKNNPSNLLLFREQNYIQNIMCPFFDSIHQNVKEFILLNQIGGGPQNTNEEYATENEQNLHKINNFSTEKITNITLMLKLVKIFVAPSLNPSALMAAQKSIFNSGLLQKVTVNILMSSGIPSHLLIQALLTTGQIIKGCSENQEYFSTLMAPSQPPKFFLEVLIKSMLSEGKPLKLRRSILHFLHSYLYRNNRLQTRIISSLLTNNQHESHIAHILVNALLYEMGDDETTGRERQKHMTEPLNVWFACLALSYTLMIATHSTYMAAPLMKKKPKGKESSKSEESSSDHNAVFNTRAAKDTFLNVRIQSVVQNNGHDISNNNNQHSSNPSPQSQYQTPHLNHLKPFMDCLIDSLKKTKNLHSKIGILALLAQWLADSPNSVKYFVSNQPNVTFLISLITNEHHPQSIYLTSSNSYKPANTKCSTDMKGDGSVEDSEGSDESNENEISAPLSDIIQSLAAFCYGLCMYFVCEEENDESDSKNKAQQETLKGIVCKRLGLENYVTKLSQLTKFELLMLDENVEALFDDKPSKKIQTSSLSSTNKNINSLCILDQEFAKTFHFYETFILKLFDDQMPNKDDYKLDQIEFVSNKYRSMLTDKDNAIKDLNNKCGDYKKQLEYLGSKYEELNSQMKAMALEQQQEKEQQQSYHYQPQPVTVGPSLYSPQNVEPQYQYPAYYFQQQQSQLQPNQPNNTIQQPMNNGYDSTNVLNPNETAFYNPQCPPGAGSPIPLQLSLQNQLLEQTVASNGIALLCRQQFLNQQGAGQNFYMNGGYYDVNSFTLTTVRADQNKNVSNVNDQYQALSSSLDLNEINAPLSNQAMKEENEKLKSEIATLTDSMAKLQKEQEGFMILIEDYEKQLDVYKRPSQLVTMSSKVPLVYYKENDVTYNNGLKKSNVESFVGNSETCALNSALDQRPIQNNQPLNPV